MNKDVFVCLGILSFVFILSQIPTAQSAPIWVEKIEYSNERSVTHDEIKVNKEEKKGVKHQEEEQKIAQEEKVDLDPFEEILKDDVEPFEEINNDNFYNEPYYTEDGLLIFAHSQPIA